MLGALGIYEPIVDFAGAGATVPLTGFGYNLAKALTALSDEVWLYAFLGNDDEADRILRQLSRDGIAADGVSRTLQSTPTSVVLYDPDGRRQIYCDLKDIQEQTLPSASVDFDGCAIAAICNINFNRALIKEAKAKGVSIATDVHVLSDIEDDYNRDFMESADILFLSDEALPCPPEAFIRRLHDRYHNRVIVIGMGSKGAMLLDGATDNVFHLSACHDVKVVNTVGAGDALFAAFLHYTAKGLSPIEALKRAEVFAAVKIETNGASKGFCAEDEVEARFVSPDISIKEL